MRKFTTGLAGMLLVAGCSTTVPGTPIADPSAVPKPETGSYSTSPRDVGQANTALGLVLEGRRMAETAPLISSIDPAIRYGGSFQAGTLIDGPAKVRSILGDVAGDALQDREVGFFAGATERKPGVRSTAQPNARSVTVGLIRMPSPAAAAGAVSPKLLDKDPDAGATMPAKTSVKVPGYSAAVAFSQRSSTASITAAYLAYKQFVAVVYGDFSPEQIQKHFDAQIKGLESFTPTSLSTVTTLPIDEPGIARYTLSPPTGDPTRTGSIPVRVALMSQSDSVSSQKLFAENGIDAMGQGGSGVYRAKDAAAAARVRDAFAAETKGFYTDNQPIAVKGVPGAVCITAAQYVGSSNKVYWCVVSAGRYVSEFAARQEQQLVQGIGAIYLMLKDAT